jgi:hypothetical protein
MFSEVSHEEYIKAELVWVCAKLELKLGYKTQ